MNSKDRRDDWTVVIAVALIAFGAWVLLKTTVGDILPIRQAIKMVGQLVLPLSLIAVGLLLYYTARRGPIGSSAVDRRRIYRSRTERMIGGVLGGLGDYLGIDPVWLRVATVLLVLMGAGGLIVLYIIAMVVIPEEPEPGSVSPVWPAGPDRPAAEVPTPPPASSGWPHTGEQSAPPPPAPPEPPSTPDAGADQS